MTSFYSHGKLLLTGEYLVMDGAKALAIPTKKGQRLSVLPIAEKEVRWKSLLADGGVWFEVFYPLPLDRNFQHPNAVIQKLHYILWEAQQFNPSFLNSDSGFQVVSSLEFNRDWGLGSSSSLISNIAQWAQVNPYLLLDKTFGGSGYDIACAKAETPITYQRIDNKPIINPVHFDPPFKDQLFFVHLNRKQNSRESIEHYRSLPQKRIQESITYISALTEAIIKSNTLKHFENQLDRHEKHLSEVLNTPTIKRQLFLDFPRTIKSLGGWGGDFVLATGGEQEMGYFKEKGYRTIVPFLEMFF